MVLLVSAGLPTLFNIKELLGENSAARSHHQSGAGHTAPRSDYDGPAWA
jgi:hypothetical protein